MCAIVNMPRAPHRRLQGDELLPLCTGSPSNPMLDRPRQQALTNRILLENFVLPGDLVTQVEAFAVHYNPQRHHGSLSNVTPALRIVPSPRQFKPLKATQTQSHDWAAVVNES